MNYDLVVPQNYIVESIGGFSMADSIVIPENISPSTYLSFAKEDFESSIKDRSNINAFANAKRAIHFQTDIISKAFGVENLPKIQRDNFPKKIEFCKKCGVVGSRILGKLNKIRNKIEHDYYLPKRAEAENIIDVAELFLTATARFISQFPTHVEISLTPKSNNILPGVAGIEFPMSKGMLSLFPDLKELESNINSLVDLAKLQRENSIKFNVNQSKQYFEWVNFLVKNTQ